MQACSNCGDTFDPEATGLVLTSKRRLVAAICGKCCQDVRVAKIVVRRPEIGDYGYEQWLPTEMMDIAPRPRRVG